MTYKQLYEDEHRFANKLRDDLVKVGMIFDELDVPRRPPTYIDGKLNLSIVERAQWLKEKINNSK